jgi:hypothetical protein
MPETPPFIDPATGGLDTAQIRREAYPLAGLVALFAGLAFVPFVFVLLFAGSSPLGALLTLLSQLVIAIGTGIVLMYVIARGITLADA